MGTVIVINGSPRKTWNTATLLEHALKGAESAGAKTELVHLYDLDYKGCTSCFACKLKGGKSYGKCALNDDLTPVLDRISRADAFILGSPVYLGTATGEMRSFLERLAFPYLVYDREHSSLFPKKIPTAFIYTMGADERRAKEMGFDAPIRLTERVLGWILAPLKLFWSLIPCSLMIMQNMFHRRLIRQQRHGDTVRSSRRTAGRPTTSA